MTKIIHHSLSEIVLTKSNELRVSELIKDKGRCSSGSVFECMCSPVFPSTHLFVVLSWLRHEIQRELENVAYKLWTYCFMITIVSSKMSVYPSVVSSFLVSPSSA